MSEDTLWRRLRDHTKGRGTLMYRIETGATAHAIPDVYFMGRLGVAGWIELKAARRPVMQETPVNYHYRPGQVQWLETAWRRRVPAYVLAQVQRRYFLHRGRDLRNMGVGITLPYQSLIDTAHYSWEAPWQDEATEALLAILNTGVDGVTTLPYGPP